MTGELKVKIDWLHFNNGDVLNNILPDCFFFDAFHSKNIDEKKSMMCPVGRLIDVKVERELSKNRVNLFYSKIL